MKQRPADAGQSSATVQLAAQALVVELARIAKSIAFRNNQGRMLLVTAGDARVDKKLKTALALKPK